MGPICSTCVHSQIHLHYMCNNYSQSGQPFDHISHAFFYCWPLTPPPPPNPPWGIVGRIVFSQYLHSQMNPQTCTEFGANRSIRLAAFPDFNLWPPNPPPPPNDPPVVLRGELYLAMSIPRRIRRNVPNLVPIGRAILQLPGHLNLWPPKNPPKCPWGIVGRIVFSLCPFPDESADVYQIRCQSVQSFDSFPRLLNLRPPTPLPKCPLGYWGATWIYPMPIPR